MEITLKKAVNGVTARLSTERREEEVVMGRPAATGAAVIGSSSCIYEDGKRVEVIGGNLNKNDVSLTTCGDAGLRRDIFRDANGGSRG